MSITKAWDVAHVRFRVPDLDRMQSFLHDFGMADARRTDDCLFMRGHSADPFVHVTERGEVGFIGLGFVVTPDELDRLAARENVPVEPFDAPGGGRVVRLHDPDGFVIEVIAGQEPAAPLPSPEPQARNESSTRNRVARVKRIGKGPAHVLRLGHVVLSVSDFARSETWYKERFGLVTSDEIRLPDGMPVGAFMRCDRGDVPCDHHTLFLFQRPGGAGFIHSAFEVADIDDLMSGHDHLRHKGYLPFWGIGRHLLGSQVFDYWRDPWGHEIEHWTDGDQFTAHDKGGIGSMTDLLTVQWGMEMPVPPGMPP